MKKVRCVNNFRTTLVKYFCDLPTLIFSARYQKQTYRISGIFRVGLIFAEFESSLKSPKIDTVKKKTYYLSSLRVLEIAKFRLGENLTHLSSVIFAKISWREKFPIYGIFHLCIVHTKVSCLYWLPPSRSNLNIN